MNKYNELVKKLKEIFQIDKPELDFGIYRILNARADEINDYLENKLKAKVKTVLSKVDNTNRKELEQQLNIAIKAASDAGISSDDSPVVKELKNNIEQLLQGTYEHENTVFTHLLTFFSRYYDSGDFISKRRYKGDTYAIPYSGEEVILHWANKDQYYIKSGENFANYSFKLRDGRKVSFKLLTADIAKDNRKDNDADRRFVLVDAHVRTKIDENGEEYQEKIEPIELISNEELIFNFEYKAMKKGTKQDKLVQDAINTIVEHELVQTSWIALTQRAPTKKKPTRTELERHLTTYTQRNTADYFIHKDLGGFLSNELDFYIKNEVMHLDSIQNAAVFSDVAKQFYMIQCLRLVALDLIIFLAQLENFQKKLWNKKKFVSDTDYLFSLDMLGDELFEIIIINQAQWDEWYKLGFIDSNVPKRLTIENNKNLIIDTSLFENKFKEKLLSNINGLDDALVGTLIHSDNYQALNLISQKYESKADLIYIDPPYNTNSTPILYKNEYKSSSWASLMSSRLELSMKLLKSNGVKAVAIDDSEVTNLSKIMEGLSSEHRLTRVTVVHNPKGSITKDFNRTHEYCLFLTNEEDKEAIGRTLEENKNPRKMRRWGENSLRTERRLSFYPIYICSGKIVNVGVVPDDEFNPESKNVSRSDGTIEVWPIDQHGIERRWNFGLDSIHANLDRIAVIEKDGVFDLFLTHEKTVPKTVWSGGEYDAGKYGNSLLISMFGNKLFDFPKSINLVKRCIDITTHKAERPLVIDYFAGSGTTAHAVIELNRMKTNGESKTQFVIVEQGEYFNSVTKPRVIKAAFSDMWDSGKAMSPSVKSSFAAKVIKLESYEDSLNNINLMKTQVTAELFGDVDENVENEYLIKYMLEVESKNSLLNTDNFRKPFSYKMNITTDSAGASESKRIDLVETFNFLIGLNIDVIDSNLDRGYIRINGVLPNGDKALIFWRDCDKIGYEDLTEFTNIFDLYAKDKSFDVIYINGDHNLPAAFTSGGNDGEITRKLKIRQIEPEFLSRMFAEEV